MSVIINGSQIREILLGQKVDRATATIPQTAAQNLFSVSGGRVLMTGLVGEVTTVIGGTATTAKITSTPTAGTAVDIASATAITSKEVGAQITLPLTSGGAAVVSNAGNGGQFPGHAPYILPSGCTLSYTTSANTTGSIKWSITYVVLDDGASVAAL